MDGITIIIVSLMISTSYEIQIEQHMTDEEIFKVFKTTRDEVANLKYEVVPLHHDFYLEDGSTINRRAVPKLKLKAFKKDYNLFLERTGHVLFGGDTPVFMAKTKSKQNMYFGAPEIGIQYTKTKFVLPKNFETVHSRKPRAALTVYPDDKNRLHFEGVINDNLLVRPMPERIHDEVLVKFLNEFSPKDEESGNYFSYKIDDDSSTETFPNSTHHIVMNLTPMEDVESDLDYSDTQDDVSDDEQLDEELERSIKGYNEPQVEAWQILYDGRSKRIVQTKEPKKSGNSTSTKAPKGQAQRKKPNQNKGLKLKKPVPPPKSKPASKVSPIAYLELLVVVDHETLRIHGQSVKELLKYLAGFWNAVDLRFREFQNPSVRLNIAGIIIPEQPEAAYYLEEFIVGPKIIEVEETLGKLGQYFATKFSRSLCKYDAVVGLMARSFGMYGRDGEFTTSIGGLAHIGQACQLDSGYNGILVKDLGVFDGIIAAAHEVGHSIGAYHDGDEPDDKGKTCNWDDGFIMSYEVKNKNHFHWSKLQQDGNQHVPKGTTDCVLLDCVLKVDSNVNVTFSYSPPEGVSCGQKKICLDGECVAEPPNL